MFQKCLISTRGTTGLGTNSTWCGEKDVCLSKFKRNDNSYMFKLRSHEINNSRSQLPF